MDAKTYFCRAVIDDYAKRDADGYSLFVYQIPYDDLRIFIAHFLSAEDYADALVSHSRTHVYIDELKPVMQEFIDSVLDDMNAAYMEEHGIHWLRTSNGDYVCARKY